MIKPWHIILVIGLLVSASVSSFAQQDPKFSQYMFNPLGINPAYAGSREVVSFVGLYRNQWVGFEGAPSTQTFAVHGPLMNKTMGLGFQVTNDEIGVRNTISTEVNYAYRFPLLGGKMSFGLGAGLNYYTFDWTDIVYKDETDLLPAFGDNQILKPDVDFGIFYNTKKMYVGLELAHLLEPRVDYPDSLIQTGLVYQQIRHYSFTLGRAFVLNEKFTLKPSMLYKQAGLYRGALDLNMSVLYNEKLWAGISIRPTYGAALILEYLFSEKFRLGYSFEYPLNELRFSYGSTHEVFLGFELGLPRSVSTSPRYF